MTVRWILETNVFAEECFDSMIKHFQDNSIPYSTVRIKPFVHEIDGQKPSVNPEDKAIAYGSIGIQSLCNRESWSPGVWTGENFSERFLVEKFPDVALNSDAKFCKLSEVLELPDLPDPFFIKPTTDTKEFAGMVIEIGEFTEWYQKMVSIGYFDESILDLNVCVSKPKKTGMEWRLVVVNSQVVGGSIYRQYRRVRPEEGWTPEVARIAEQTYANPPAPVYVVDVCESEDGLKIVEFNTFNSAGLYKIKVGPVIDAINNFVANAE